jgi:hypothetical protein
VRFIESNRLTPVVSTASLGEIERGERPERVAANIASLLDIGSRFILEADSRIHIVSLSSARIWELLASKNTLIEDTVNVVNAVQFYLISCTSKDELDQRIAEVTEQIRVLIRRHGDTKVSRDLEETIALMETVRMGGIPAQYNWAGELRSRLAIDPREINNLRPKDLWRTIEEVALASGSSLPFDVSRGSTRERIYNALLSLNAIGYWADGINSREKQLAFNYDCMHGIYGALCGVVISADKRFVNRLHAVYYHIGIATRTFLLAGGQFIECND